MIGSFIGGRSTAGSHGWADLGSQPMQRPEYPRSTDALWANATSADSWISIVGRAFVFLGRTVPLSRLYATIERHPKAAGSRSFWRHHVHEVLGRLGASVRLDADIWRLISERPAKESVPRRGPGRRPSPRRPKQES